MARMVDIIREALISDCGKYRYLLRRTWGKGRTFLYIMLNPSTADDKVDDATMRSLIRLSKEGACGGFEVINLMAWRATDPKNLPSDVLVAQGPENYRIAREALQRCSVAVCAWGAHPSARRYATSMLSLIDEHHSRIYCFGKTKDGYPKHPLYIKSGTKLELFT